MEYGLELYKNLFYLDGFGFLPGETVTGSLSWNNWLLCTAGMVMRGFSDEPIEKILGKNLLMVFAANAPDRS